MEKSVLGCKSNGLLNIIKANESELLLAQVLAIKFIFWI